ncbi:hypothetical protein CYMTET_44765 [Cymbomonas tetramitiformis]|uniref:Uncharacterized protein n=1 Tax=Cymbomonas tetramitiformis TaxID=36881 RepID=A0AAE0BZJ7_9CHLO|nr:hypothetical protein CYMTET_44765 [Cymbomonas tetramitiformis]
MCGSMGDEIQYLMAAPNIECWEGAHIPMLLVSTIAFFVYVVGVPTVFFRVLRYGVAHNLLTDKDFMQQFSWMYEIYELRWIYWQLTIFARRGLCAAVLVFSQKNPYLQTILAMILLTANICAHFFTNAFLEPWLDIMDSTSLLSLYFTVISGMVYITQDENAIDTQVWTVIFFIAIGLQMMLGISIFMMDIHKQRHQSSAVENLDRRYEKDNVKYSKRHFKLAAGLAELRLEHSSSSSAGATSMEAVISLLRGLDVALSPSYAVWYGTKLYNQACLLAQYNLGDPKDRQDTDDQGIPSKVPTMETVRLLPLVDIQLVLHSLALDFLECLMKAGIRETEAMFEHLDSEKEQNLKAEEIFPIWEVGMQNTLNSEGIRLLLDCLVTALRGGEEMALQLEHLQDGMVRLLSGELRLVDMIFHEVDPERAQALSALMARTAKEIVKKGVGISSHATFRCKSLKPRKSKYAKSMELLQKLTATDKEAKARCENWTALSKILDPAAMKVWSKDGRHIHSALAYEAANCFDDMEHATHEHYVHVHNTDFKSVFYHKLFDSFPYLIDWIAEASAEKVSGAQRFLSSLRRFQGERLAAGNTYSRADFIQVHGLATVGEMWLQRYNYQAGQYIKTVFEDLYQNQTVTQTESITEPEPLKPTSKSQVNSGKVTKGGLHSTPTDAENGMVYEDVTLPPIASQVAMIGNENPCPQALSLPGTSERRSSEQSE